MKILRWLLVFLGIAGLIGVRTVEDAVFYDPFLSYFHEANKGAAFPEFEWSRLISGHLLRFLLNLLFSLLIVQGLFNKRKWTLQAAVLILIAFLITFPLYLYCVSVRFETGYLFSFYIRRFVIQPLVLLLIVPLFYYRRFVEQKNEVA